MTAVVDRRITKSQAQVLSESGFELLKIEPADYLAEPVSSHPDMIFFSGFGKLFCHKNYYEQNESLIQKISELSSSDIVLSCENTNQTYPYDVLFNACLIGSSLICNPNTLSGYILDEAHKANINIIPVKQGYTKCSCAVISENSIITSDKGIFSSCLNNSIDALLIQPGFVSLPGYNYGFIGGTSGHYGDNVYFSGDLRHHPDYERIIEFIYHHHKKYTALSNDELIDLGTMYFF